MVQHETVTESYGFVDLAFVLVEHIWADHPEHHTDEFAHEADFARHRNRIGDLLLLPKQFNASYNDDPYEKKLPHYYGQNLLAASLNPLSYEKNPGFINETNSSPSPFSNDRPALTAPRKHHAAASRTTSSTQPRRSSS